MSADPQSAARPAVIAVVAASTAAQVASVMGIAVFPAIAPSLAAALEVEPSLVGYQMSLIYCAAMLMAPSIGNLISRWGACRATQAGLGLTVLAMLLSLTSSLPALAGASVFAGMAIGLLTPASAHLLFRFSPPANRNFIFSFKQTGVPLAWVLMALIAPPVTLAFGWRWALALIIAYALVMIAVLQPVRAAWDDDRARSAAVAHRETSGLAVVWRQPVLRPLALMSFWCSFVQLSFSSFAVTMLVEETGYSLVEAGWLLSLAHAAGVTGRIVWGWIADATDALAVLHWVNLITVACCALTAFVSPGWPAAALALLFVVFGVSAVGWNGVFFAEVARRSPPGRVSVAAGGAMALSFAGIVVGPAIFATVYKLTGSYAATFGWLTLAAVTGLVFLMRAQYAARRR
ncbi:MAG: MFS transporter [Betaproteobacteria bacterium]|nr:MFS transporter [Betaproteobacteria bacterium]